jgi:hypothetical protein
VRTLLPWLLSPTESKSRFPFILALFLLACLLLWPQHLYYDLTSKPAVALADNAPVSRAVVVAAVLFSVPFGFRSRFLDLGLSYQASPPTIPSACTLN